MWPSYLVLTDLVPYRGCQPMEAKGQLTYQWIWPPGVDHILSWVLVEYWSLYISQVSVEYRSSIDWHIDQSSVNLRSIVLLLIVSVVCQHCIGEPLVEYQYVSMVYWSSIVSAETNLVPWCKHLDILISPLLSCKLHFPRLEYSKHFLRYTPPADTQIPPISAVFFDPLDNNNLWSVIPDRVK